MRITCDRAETVSKLLGAIALLCSAVAPMPAGAAAIEDLRVMSFNIRTANANDGPNDWDGNRKNLVEQTIRNFTADIVGLQESLKRQSDFLGSSFGGFKLVGNSVEGNNDGEFTTIMYRSNRFTEISHGNFQLSKTPDVPGSESWGTAFPRNVTWVKLSDNKNPGFNFMVMNTHWDHVSATARLESATLMRSMIHDMAQDLPVIVTGDFNADEGTDPYRRMTGRDDFDNVRTLNDSYRNIHPENSATVGTAPGFDGVGGDGRIDWILHDNDFTTVDANIDHTSYNGFYPSDHSPITAVLLPKATAIPEPAGLAAIGIGTALLRRRRVR